MERVVEDDHRGPAGGDARDLDGVLDRFRAGVDEQALLLLARAGRELGEPPADLDIRLVETDHHALVQVAVDLLVQRRHDGAAARGRGSGSRARRRSRCSCVRRRPRRAHPRRARPRAASSRRPARRSASGRRRCARTRSGLRFASLSTPFAAHHRSILHSVARKRKRSAQTLRISAASRMSRARRPRRGSTEDAEDTTGKPAAGCTVRGGRSRMDAKEAAPPRRNGGCRSRRAGPPRPRCRGRDRTADRRRRRRPRRADRRSGSSRPATPRDSLRGLRPRSAAAAGRSAACSPTARSPSTAAS